MGHKNTGLMNMMLALNGVKLYFPNSFPFLQVKLFILPTMSLAAEKHVLDYAVNFDCYWLIIIMNFDNHRAIDRTGSSSNSNKAND